MGFLVIRFIYLLLLLAFLLGAGFGVLLLIERWRKIRNEKTCNSDNRPPQS